MDQEVKNISSDAEKRPEQVAKYTVKDSIKNVTITNVLLDQYYNDVGFQIGEKIVILVEQQSSWSINIVVRCLFILPRLIRNILRAQNRMYMGAKNWSFQSRRCTSYSLETGSRGQNICFCQKSFLTGMTVFLM